MKKMNFYSFTLMCLGMIFFVGCTQDPGSNPNAFRLEDGPNGIAGGARYGYLGADQVKEIPNQNTNTLQNGTVFLDPSNTGGSSNDNKVVPKYPANDGNDTNTNKIVSNEPAKDKPDPENSKQPSGNKPYANPVPGKVGHVYSPFANGREVDVTGFPPGTEVRCPYTKMIFRVP